MKPVSKELARLQQQGTVRYASHDELNECVRRGILESPASIGEFLERSYVLEGGRTVWINIEDDQEGIWCLSTLDQRFYVIAIREDDGTTGFSIQSTHYDKTFKANFTRTTLEACMKLAKKFQAEIAVGLN